MVQFALLQSIFLFSQFSSELPSGVLSDIFRRKTIITSGLIILTVSPIIMLSTLSFSKSVAFVLLIVAFVLEGIGNAFLSGADDALFYEAMRREGKEELYGKIRGQVQLIGAISVGIATFLGGVLYSINMVLPYLLQSVMVLCSMAILLTVKDANSHRSSNLNQQKVKPILSTLSVFKEMTQSANILFMFLFSTVTAAMVNAIFALLPDYVSKLGFSSTANGAIFMIYSFVGGIVATQAHRLSKFSYKTLVIIVSLLLLVGMAFQVQKSNYLFLFGACLLYIVEDVLDPIVMQLLNLWVKDESRATFISGLSFSISLLTMIANPIIGFIMLKFGTINMLIASALITVSMIVVSYFLILRTRQDAKSRLIKK